MGWDWIVKIVLPFDESTHDPDKACHQRDPGAVRIALEVLGPERAEDKAHERICAACLHSMNKNYCANFRIPAIRCGDGRWISHNYQNPISQQPFCLINWMRSGEYRIGEIAEKMQELKSAPPPPAYLEAACDAYRETLNVLEWIHERLILHPGARADVSVD